MGMRISTNVDSLTAQRNLLANQDRLNSSMEKLSSGSRINKSADDAAGLAISETLRAKQAGLGQAQRNANDGISLIQVTESSLNEVGNNLIRMRELAVQASSDTIGATERGYLDKEYQELSKEIDRISENTEFNGRKLLKGDGNNPLNVDVQVGYNSGESNVLKLAIDKTDVQSLGLENKVISGASGSTIATENLGALDNALNSVAERRATLGSMQSRMNSAITSISVSGENMAAANSRIRDVDFASETAKLTQARIMSQASVSILSQANQKPEMALALLR